MVERSRAMIWSLFYAAGRMAVWILAKANFQQKNESLGLSQHATDKEWLGILLHWFLHLATDYSIWQRQFQAKWFEVAIIPHFLSCSILSQKGVGLNHPQVASGCGKCSLQNTVDVSPIQKYIEIYSRFAIHILYEPYPLCLWNKVQWRFWCVHYISGDM